jgi:hypothetical protein
MSTCAPSVLWRLVGPNGHLSECQLWELPSGHFQIRLVHDRSPEATERYNTSTDAVARAAMLASAFVERGWRDAAI